MIIHYIIKLKIKYITIYYINKQNGQINNGLKIL